MTNKQATISRLRAVMASKQKETVTAELTDEFGGKRIYTVFVTLKGETHRHYVTISDQGARCCCTGFHIYKHCKHVRCAAEKDSILMGEQNERLAAA